MFTIGSEVRWASQAAGVTRVKVGRIVEVVEAYATPKTPLPGGLPTRRRDHVSYVVKAVAGGTQTESKRNYWPHVKGLESAGD
jgi:hypothetical protein